MKNTSYCADIIVADYRMRLYTYESHIFYALNEYIKVVPAEERASYSIELKSFSSATSTVQFNPDFNTTIDGEDAYIGYYSRTHKKAVFLFYDTGEIAISIGNALRQLVFFLNKELEFLIMHSAAALMQGEKGILLCGRSGNGKSTATNLLTDMSIISDDLVVIGFKEDKPLIWAMPGSKSSPNTTNKGFPLAAIFLLIKAGEEAVEAISPTLAIANTFVLYGIDEQKTLIRSRIELLNKLVKKVPAFNLYFCKTTELTKLIKSVLIVK